MSMRKITSMTMFVSLAVLLINSIILYIVPEGRIANWAVWQMAGLTKGQWADQHTTVGILFLVASGLHLFYNWAAIKAYMKNKAKEIKVFTGSFNVAVVLTLLVVVGTYYEVPPLSTIIDISVAIKADAAKTYGEPPYGHAESSSLNFLAKKEQLDVDKAMALLKEAGVKVESPKEILMDIAANNKLTPQKVYEIMKPAKKEVEPAAGGVATVSAPAVSFPDHPQSGFGRKTLGEACGELGVNLQMIIDGLQSLGVVASGEQTIKDIGAAYDKEPMEIFEMMHGLVVKD